MSLGQLSTSPAARARGEYGGRRLRDWAVLEYLRPGDGGGLEF
ncbi:hypothetical protein ABZ801_40905 [Actinomadura sp. NPDC047616]